MSALKTAKKIARSGQPVFPCHASGDKAKRPMTRHGYKDATTDMDQIKEWWSRRPNAAIGIPTGVLWDVLDVDVKREEDGRVHLPTLQRLGLLNGCQRVVQTPSGGWHLYFGATTGLTNKASATLGLDVRSMGGYVLAPGSFIDTEDYEGYYVEHDPPVGFSDEPLWWDLIKSALTPMNTFTKQPVTLLDYERQHSIAALRAWLSERKEGERNNSLHWAVCRCIDNGIDPHELVDVATVILGSPEDEVLKTINSALVRAGVKASDLRTEGEALFPDQA